MILNSDLTSYLDIAEEAMEEAIKLYKYEYADNLKIESLEGKDIKTKADYEISELLIKRLKKTNLNVISEESSEKDLSINPLQTYWLIDPLDGTYNAERGFPIAAISIALMDKENNPLAGLVYHLGDDKLFKSYGNKCAQVSKTKTIDQSVLVTGFPSGRNYSNNSLKKTINNIQRFKKVRMLGSAACMILEVARGRFDVYMEEDIYLWDVAGALAILENAGGKYLLIKGSVIWKYNVIATNSEINFEDINMSP